MRELFSAGGCAFGIVGGALIVAAVLSEIGRDGFTTLEAACIGGGMIIAGIVFCVLAEEIR